MRLLIYIFVFDYKITAISCCLFALLYKILVVYLQLIELGYFMEDTVIPYELPEVENHSFFSLTNE